MKKHTDLLLREQNKLKDIMTLQRTLDELHAKHQTLTEEVQMMELVVSPSPLTPLDEFDWQGDSPTAPEANDPHTPQDDNQSPQGQETQIHHLTSHSLAPQHHHRSTSSDQSHTLLAPQNSSSGPSTIASSGSGSGSSDQSHTPLAPQNSSSGPSTIPSSGSGGGQSTQRKKREVHFKEPGRAKIFKPSEEVDPDSTPASIRPILKKPMPGTVRAKRGSTSSSDTDNRASTSSSSDADTRASTSSSNALSPTLLECYLPPMKRAKRGGPFTQQEVKEMEDYFCENIVWGKTSSASACVAFLELHPHPEKGRIAHDIQDKMKRLIAEKKGRERI